MYLWRFSIAITLGLIWYFSDWGRTVTQYFLGFLFCFTTPLLLGNTWQESSTQTDEEPEEKKTFLDPISEPLFDDLTDGHSSSQCEPQESQYPQVKTSLQQVFECAYAQLVLPWYSVPEPCENQPLHLVLSREIDFVIDRIIDRAKDFDVCQAVVGSIRIVTQHLHNAKQSRWRLFNSQAEEIAVLRGFSDALVRNLFPKTLWGQEVNRCVLNEIVAVKGLGLLVTWLSDPDNLNLLVVSLLDSVTPKGSVDESSGSDPERGSSSQDGEGDVEREGEGSQVSLEGVGLESNNSIKGKKRDKLRKGWNKFVDKMKSKKAKKKKMKRVEQEIMWRFMGVQGDVSNEDDVSSREGSVHGQQDSDRDDGDSDLENYLTCVQEDMMEFKLSYEMWRVGHWAVSIPHADWENEELFFTVHLEEKDSPENLQWDIRKSYKDVLNFCKTWQDSSSILSLEENEVNEVRLSVECFLEELVSDNLRGPTQPVFQFLCPLEKLLNDEVHSGGVWSILSGLAYILTPGHEEDEMGTPQNESPKEVTVPFPKSESPPPESPGTASENSSDITVPTLPAIIISSCETPGEAHKEDEAENEPLPTATSVQDKPEDSDIPPTSHFKMLFRGLSRSQESLSQTKITDDEEQPQSDCSQNGGSQVQTTQPLICTRSNKKEKICFRACGGANKAKQSTLPRGEESPFPKGQTNWEQLETTKVIFDLLKEISGNSILINIFDAILKPVMPILKKKVNSFFNKMNPSEAQIASYVNTLRAKLWPESPVAPAAPRTDEQKNQTKERAHSLINAKYSNVLILKKTVMESVFNIFQEREANKTLAYMLLSFLLRELLPNEHGLNVSATALHKVTNN